MKHLVMVVAVMAAVAMFAAPASAGLLYLAAPTGGPDALVMPATTPGTADDGLGASLTRGIGGASVTSAGFATGPSDPPSGGYRPECIPSTPEPGTLSLLGTSLLGLFAYMRRRKSA